MYHQLLKSVRRLKLTWKNLKDNCFKKELFSDLNKRFKKTKGFLKLEVIRNTKVL